MTVPASPGMTVWAAVVLPVAVAGIYANTLHNPFVYDDQLTIIENPSIRQLSNLEYVVRGALFRPVVNLSYAIDWHFWQLDPFGYHLTGLVLHAMSAVLFFLLCRQLVRPGDSALKAVIPAALFAVHPALSEAVGYTAARSELLAAFFSLLALLAFHRAAISGRLLWRLGAWFCLLLGLASKEIAAAVPLVALLIDALFLAPAGRRQRLRSLYLPPLLLLVVGGVARLAIYFLREEKGASGHFAQNLLLQVENVWVYASLLAAPVRLSIIHEFHEVSTPFDPFFLLSALGIVLVLRAAWSLRNFAPGVMLGVLWFLLFLMPSALVPLNEGFAEHRCYFASVGLFLVAGELVGRLGARWSSRAVMSVATVVLLGLAATTVARNSVWSDPVRLWSDAVAKAPNIYASHYALGDAYRLKGDCASAVPEYRAAVARGPDQAEGWNNLGICAAQLSALDEAADAFARAVSLQPKNPSMHYNFGLLARSRGDVATARAQFEETLRLSPEHVRGREALDTLK